jgi:hypothetical protein
MSLLFKTETNWKGLLSPESEQQLVRLLARVSAHRGAYLNAPDVKIAQLWCAALELARENSQLEARVRRLEWLLNGMIGRAKALDIENKEILESLGKF